MHSCALGILSPKNALRQKLPSQSAELLTLDKTIANLLRMWVSA